LKEAVPSDLLVYRSGGSRMPGIRGPSGVQRGSKWGLTRSEFAEMQKRFPHLLGKMGGREEKTLSQKVVELYMKNALTCGY